MIPKYKKEKKGSCQNIFFSVLIGSLIFIIVGFLVVSNIKMNRKRALLNIQINQLKEEVRLLEEKKHNFQAQLNPSKQEEYLEKEAREKLNLKKPGEEVVTVLPAEKNTPHEAKKIKQWWNPLSW